MHHNTITDPAADLVNGSARMRPARRLASLSIAAALAVSAITVICGGALAAVVSSDGTYVSLGGHGTYHTDSYALATDATDWRTQLLGWSGSVRVKVASASRQPIFVGVAPATAISRYLSGAAYTTIGDHARTDHNGAAPAPPAKLVDWTAQTEGAGTQTLQWKATRRPQIVLAMNLNRTRLLRVRIAASAVTLDRMPWSIPVGALATGVLLLMTAFATLRRKGAVGRA